MVVEKYPMIKHKGIRVNPKQANKIPGTNKIP